MNLARVNLVEIAKPRFDVELDIRYASNNNFTGKPVYKKPIALLHEEAAEKLQQAIYLAKNIGYGIKLFDAFRPHEVQQALWNHTPDESFLSNPETGSVPHCRGVAVDLTLTKDGREVDMGTGFDAFTPMSHHGCTDITVAAQKNRFILMGIMSAAGWDFYRNEWWHYQLFKSREYPLIKEKDAKTGIL